MTFDTKIFAALFTLCTICFSPLFSQGQDQLTGLRQNPTLQKISREAVQAKDDRSQPALKLPFFEDFSDYLGYPNPDLWMDKMGFVNYTFAIYPPSIGVVTLDALDENGKVYAHATASPFAADTLTSRLIRLDTNFVINRPMTIGDSLYFSFFYQPGGGYLVNPWEAIGNKPESGDKLILEFGFATGEIIFVGYTYTDYILTSTYYAGDSIPNIYIPGTYYVFEEVGFPGQIIQMPSDSLFAEEMEWDEVWSTAGTSLNSWLAENPLSYFKQVIIPILDEKYLRNNFQFRFRNYASLEDEGIEGWASNVDQWHLDYIRLDARKNRDEYAFPNDVAFVMPTTSFLKQYQAMPWNQFRQSDMKTNFENCLANISSNRKNTNYTYSIYKDGAPYAPQYTSNNENTEPYSTAGFHTYDKHATPLITFTITPDGRDSATFKLVHVFQIEHAVSDIRNSNDTMTYEQKFHNYYAYDDGTPEAGYSILSAATNPEISFAMRFCLAEPDTLRSVRMFFNGVHNNTNDVAFTLKVWTGTITTNGDTIPGTEIYSQESLFPEYAENYLDFVDYFLDEPMEVSGIIFVGFEQQHNVQLNLGFDQNSDARSHFMYKVTNEWKQSFLKGSPMVRIVLGKYFDPNGITEPKEIAAQIKVYPNPTSSHAKIEISDPAIQISQLAVYDMYGKLLEIQNVHTPEIEVDMSRFAPGIYLVRLQNQKGTIHTVKIVKQ